MRATLKPLTPEERAVAETNLWIVHSFLRAQKLPQDDWFDVVIFHYLLTVEKWFREPRLYHYEFTTIAWKAMRSAVGNEKKKQRRQIKTVSLDDPVPGTDGLTWQDIITEDKLMEAFKKAGAVLRIMKRLAEEVEQRGGE